MNERNSLVNQEGPVSAARLKRVAAQDKGPKVNAAGTIPARPLFSIVTVCFNAQTQLPATLADLRRQTFDDYEYVVVDGASTDGTLQLLAAAGEMVDRLISEPDCGIYDAMNKATRVAQGEFIYFLNAGDEFADENVLGDVAAVLRAAPEVDLLYGAAIFQSPTGRLRQTYEHLTATKLPFANLCHQAVFARRTLFERFGEFNLGYRVVADLDWLVRMFRAGVARRCVDRDICVFVTGGMHEQHAELLRSEKLTMQQRLFGRLGAAAGRFQFRAERRLRRIAAW